MVSLRTEEGHCYLETIVGQGSLEEGGQVGVQHRIHAAGGPEHRYTTAFYKLGQYPVSQQETTWM